jgi:HEAT repeat protein
MPVDAEGGDEIRVWVGSFAGTSLLMINTHPGEGFRAILMVPMNNQSSMYDPLWTYPGVEHLYDGKINNYGYVFDSDPQYPLTFKLIKDKGYAYLCGRGTVTDKDGKSTRLGFEDTIATWLSLITSPEQIHREGAAEAIGWLAKSDAEKESALSVLIPALKDSSMPVRRDAAEALGKINDVRAVTPLFDLLSDPNAWVADVAAEALQSGPAVGLSEKQITSLIANLSSAEKDSQLRAIRILGASKNSLAFKPLTEALKNDNPEVKAEVATALGVFGDQRSLSLLMGLLTDTSPAIRSGAARGLGYLGSKDAVPALINALSDGELDVRVATAGALGILGDSSAILPLENALVKAEYTNEKDAINNALELLKQ